MRKLIYIALILGAGYSIGSYAQERPPIEVYSPREYGAENQNWAISQSHERDIYVANNDGLLKFNGANWELYRSPNESKMRSVKVINSRVYTGCHREFGYWQNDTLGNLAYHSLSQELGITFLEDEEIWNIIALERWILFQSLKRIYIYDSIEGSYSIINSETTIYKMFEVKGSIYFQKTRDGLYRIENGEARIVSSDNVLQNNLLVNIFDYQGGLLIQTEDNGLFVMNDTNLASWNVPANDVLKNVSVYRSMKLRGGGFLMGTISNGVIQITNEGEIDYEIDVSNGLSNNTVLSVFEDLEGNIWLGLDNGINCINVNAPFHVYNDDEGRLGTVYASAVYEGNIYLGTNQGLFYKPLDANTGFSFIEGTQSQVWNLTEIDNTLFCGHNSGTFIINGGQATLISDIQGTWDIKAIDADNRLLLQGNYDGLYVLERNGQSWRLRNKISGFDKSSRYFEFDENQTIFVSHEYKGVFRVQADSELQQAIQVTKDSSITIGKNSGLVKYGDNILFASKHGIFKYLPEARSFEHDSVLSQLLPSSEYITGKLIPDPENDRLWGFTSKNLNFISRGNLSGIPELIRIALPQTQRKGMMGYENISYLADQKYLIGTTSGYMIIDLDKLANREYFVQIDKITNFRSNEETTPVNLSATGIFSNNSNHMLFEFSVAEFDKYYEAEYQYILDGIDDSWSSWSSDPLGEYRYLPHGAYEFKVRARVGNVLSSNVASFSFEIQRPWLLSNVMIATYILALLLFSLVTHNIYKGYYKKQRNKLLEKTARELEMKELENRQQLMKFRNDKLRQDIENKNRELGISTMSLIKKNEFLGTIKKELKNLDGIVNIKHIVKIIDRNLNHTDDWNLFQEAFNNADKDFLKKMKSEHSNLTSNDLRLCAYLRLNLSSKEIAQLLNISPRSVEVKRYRLRKKMNLSHEESLTNYILEI